MKLAFMGSPEFAVPALRALAAAGHEVAAVYTQPAKPAGRGQRETPCPVHQAALALNLPVRTPKRLRGNAEEAAFFRSLELDAAVVAAYGLILPPPILAAPGRGCLNIHASLLPRWRGAAPIQAAIAAGDAQTGITIMQMEAGLDTGPMLRAEATAIGPYDTAADLHDRLAEIGARLIVEVLADPPPPRPQDDGQASYAPKLTRDDARLDFSLPADVLERRIRAHHPWPGSVFHVRDIPLKLLAATLAEGSGPPGMVLDSELTVACGQGALRLTRLQRPAKAAMDAADFRRGFPLPPGTRLT